MPRAPRARIGRKTMYNRRQQDNNTPERSQTLAQQQLNALCLKSAFNYRSEIDYLNITALQIGPMATLCPKCHAKKWKDETHVLCCVDARVVLHQFEDPPYLIKSLTDNSHPISKHFFDNSRRYNTLFQMTSFGANEIAEGNFIPTFKIQGQVHHLIDSLLPEIVNNAKILQIYFMSQSDQISTPTLLIPNLKRGLIESLQTVLRENNHLVQSFRSNLESRSFDELQNFKLIIHANRGQYNAPTIDEVPVLFVHENKGPRVIVLYGRGGHLRRIFELNNLMIHCNIRLCILEVKTDITLIFYGKINISIYHRPVAARNILFHELC
jgi:hypothetical protein